MCQFYAYVGGISSVCSLIIVHLITFSCRLLSYITFPSLFLFIIIIYISSLVTDYFDRIVVRFMLFALLFFFMFILFDVVLHRLLS